MLWMIVSLILFIGLMSSLYYLYRLNKESKRKQQQSQQEIISRDGIIATLQTQYQELTETTKELFIEPVTQLPTYKVFFEQLQRSMTESKRYSFYLALCFIEITNTSALSDEDRDMKELFLAECAQQLSLAIRKIDFLAHYEGNVFALLLTGLNQPEKASLAAQRIFDVLSRAKMTACSTLNKTISIGISIFPTDAETEKEFIAHTLSALAVAKQKGRSAYQFYEPSLQRQSQREHLIVNAINSNHFFEQLELNYYPITTLSQNKVVALRVDWQWRHPELGIVPQAECVMWAEKQNRLLGIMVWQLEKACHYFLEERARGNNVAFLSVAIPLVILRNSRFVHGLSQWLTKWAFPQGQLWLQVYGDFNHIALDEFEKAANMLQYLNIQLVLEQRDQQSLPFSYFVRIPFTYYKLSDKMLGNLLDSSRVKAVLYAMSQFMKQLSIQLIVPDGASQQRDILKQLGIELVEGEKMVEMMPES